MRVIRVAPITTPKQTESLSISPDLLVFGIDRLRGHRFLVDEIVDVISFLENPDIPGDLEIVIAATGARIEGRQVPTRIFVGYEARQQKIRPRFPLR